MQDDPFLWLEEIYGARALEWVEAENVKTLDALRSDPRFAGLYADALKILEAKDRIPSPSLIGGRVYNFWQDEHHVRGIWRRTTPAQYATESTAWQTVFDLDAFARTENANWVWQGVLSRWPGEDRCLIFLSDGGEDACTVREFDLERARFVESGFVLPYGKQRVEWENDGALLVAREWAPGDLTAAGYPFVVKRVERGRSLEEAVEVFRGSAADGGYGVSTIRLHDGDGNEAHVIQRPVSTFQTEYYLLVAGGTQRLNVPLKSEPSGLVAGRLIWTLQEDWTVDDSSFPRGAVVEFDLAAIMGDPAGPVPRLVYSPGPKEVLDTVAQTRANLVLVTYENVLGRAWVYTPLSNGGWSKTLLSLPDDSSIVVDTADESGHLAYLRTMSFLEPPRLWEVDARSVSSSVVKSSPPRFDASQHVVEQREAASKDGTFIPYFVVRPRDIAWDANNPTLLHAYGGFSVSLTPVYDGVLGKLWLERGGVYVVANIRGGGEFGPEWHDASLKTNRQRSYDDFLAVAQALMDDKVTSPRRLGIDGGSNGGLLMGVQLTKHPELWRAVDINVPLLDMLRFERIQAGASWTGEFGSVSVPEEREFLASISPYHNLKPGVAYPEPLIWTTTKDDRVGPQHARKFAAKLGAMGLPYLYYEVTEGGHSPGANLPERALTETLEMLYFIRKLMD